MRKISTIENVAYLKRADFYVSIDEIEEKGGVTRAKINELAREGIVKAVYVNNVLMLSRAGLNAWMNAQENPQPPKRRGRPPKNAETSSGEKPMKRRGRPPKFKSTDDPVKPKRPRGRPRKTAVESDASSAPRRRGRPKGSTNAARRSGEAPTQVALAGVVASLAETNALLRAVLETNLKAEHDRSYLSSSIALVESIFRTLDIELTAHERETLAKSLGSGRGEKKSVKEG